MSAFVRSRVFLATLATFAASPVAAGMRVVADVPFDLVAERAVIDPVGRKAYVVGTSRWSAAEKRISIVDLDGLTVRPVASSSGLVPYRLLVDAARGRAYAIGHDTSDDEHLVVALEGRSAEITQQIRLGERWSVAADFGRNRLYAGHDTTKRVTHVDLATGRLGPALDVGVSVSGIAIDRVRGKVVVGNGDPCDDRIAVVDHAPTAAAGWVPRHARDCDAWSWWWGPLTEEPLVDERAGLVYLQSATARVSVLSALDYGTRAIVGDGAGDFHRSDLSTISPAFGGLYQLIAEPHAWTLRRTDGATGEVAARALHAPEVPWTPRISFVVDDDGGDLLVIGGPPAVPRLLRLDPVTLTTRESLELPGLAYVGAAIRDPVTGRLLLFAGDRESRDRVVSVETDAERPDTRVAVAFHHQAFDHYFVTADPAERAAIDAGIHGTDWVPASDVFRVWTAPRPGSMPVCRFFSARMAPRSSHFHTHDAAECAALQAAGEWQFEGIAFHVAPTGADGGCPEGTEPLYRLYNDGRGGAPNHRLTASRATYDAMVAAGWVAEGTGPGVVFACTPALR